jgi:hypothetical protein
MARSVNEGFEEFLRRLVPTQAQREAGVAHRASVKAALEARLTVRTSSKPAPSRTARVLAATATSMLSLASALPSQTRHTRR